MRSAQYGLLPPRADAPVTVRARRGGYSRLAFPTVNRGCTALLYGRAVRLPSKNAGFLPGQKKWCCMCGVQHKAVSYKSRLPATAQAQKVAEGAALALAPNISASSRPLIVMFSQKVGPHRTHLASAVNVAARRPPRVARAYHNTYCPAYQVRSSDSRRV